MPTAPIFEYVKPATLVDALALMHTHGARARLLAGGTDLAVHIKEGVVAPAVVVDLKAIDELRRFEVTDGKLYMGALVTFEEIIAMPMVREWLPVLADAAATVASGAIRNRATLVGNIASAVPSLDAAPALLVYEAVVHVASAEARRDIPIERWFVAPRRTALQPDEIVCGISIQLPTTDEGGCYVKLARYAGEDLAQAGLGVIVTRDGRTRIAHTALAPCPRRATRVEALLHGKTNFDEDLLASAKKIMLDEIAPISDIRASQRYRQHMVQVMLERGLDAAGRRLNGEKIDITCVLGG